MGKAKNVMAWQRYGFAVVLTGFVALMRMFAKDWVGTHYSFMLFLPAVLLSVLYGGLGPGLLAAFCGGMIADYYFLGTPYGLHVSEGYDEGRIFVYALISLMTCIIVSQLRAARARAEANERKLQDQIAERMRVELNLREEMGERKRMEAALVETLEKAETANRAKSEFLANMSHEIRTPMNAVIGIADILEMAAKMPPEKYKELIRTLQLSAKAMMSIIDDLLDISKIENKQVELEKRMFDLRRLAEGVVTILNVQAQEKRIALLLEYEDRLDAKTFYGDTTRLHQILMNLVGNAVKFTESGSVTLRVRDCGEETQNGRDVCFEIADTGIGIAQDKLGSIFNKFSQADTSITRKFGGTGLGLAISKMLVEIMDGDISVTSEMGKGTLFKVSLSLCNPQDQASPVTRRRPHAAADPVRNARACTILVVEDHAPNILVVTTILGNLHYAYRIALNGDEAVQAVKNSRFDAILMDIQMPVMDGYQATRLIREWEKSRGLPRTPIIGVTAHALSDDKERCFGAGMDDYISKPFNHSDLENKIAALIDRKEGEVA